MSEILQDKWFWLIIAVIAFFAISISAAVFGLTSGGIFSDTPVKDWTQSEAIFYGAVVIALGLFFGGGK